MEAYKVRQLDDRTLIERADARAGFGIVASVKIGGAGGMSRDEALRLAKLFAAAPPLLAACRRASSELDGDPDRRALLAAMDRVIALAK